MGSPESCKKFLVVNKTTTFTEYFNLLQVGVQAR